MDYFASCECGSRVSAVKQATPTTKRCSCGREVPVPAADKPAATKKNASRAGNTVPPASAETRQAGPELKRRAAFDAVVRALADRSLAIGDDCAICGKPTAETLWFRIDRDGRQVVHDPDSHVMVRILSVILGGWMLALAHDWFRSAERTIESKLDTVVEVPLRIHESHQSALRKYGSAEIARLLRKVPLYARLLDAYPEAAVYQV